MKEEREKGDDVYNLLINYKIIVEDLSHKRKGSSKYLLHFLYQTLSLLSFLCRLRSSSFSSCQHSLSPLLLTY